MAKLNLSQDEINEILDAVDGGSVPSSTILKLASAVGTIRETFGSDPAELLAAIELELTEEGTNTLTSFAIDLYQQENLY